jgi:hypothetical protein
MTELSNSSPSWRPLRPRGPFAWVALLAALAVISAPLGSQAGAAPAEPAPAVRVVVDASELGSDAAYFEAQIAEQLRAGLVAEGFSVTEQGQSTIRVRLDYFDQRDRDYLIAADVVHHGRIAVSQRPGKCASCTDDELVDAALGLLPELVRALRADPQQVPAEGSEQPAPITPGPAGPHKIGPVGISGGVIAGLGLGALIAGAVEWSRGEIRPVDPTALDSIGRDHATPGKVLVGIGAGALLVGAVLLGVDLSLRAKQRKPAGRASLAPALGPTNVGLTVQGRF